MTDRESRGDESDGDASGPAAVVIFAPLPVLTVTVENRSGDADIHVHAGGQGVWQSRMMSSLGVPVVLCSALGGETGDVLGHLLPAQNVTVQTVPVSARNGSYVHDRRSGGREVVAEAAGSPLDRHELDSLYELTPDGGFDPRSGPAVGPAGGRRVARRPVPAPIHRSRRQRLQGGRGPVRRATRG
ncbi:hypothetical protein M4D79_27885, partial [Mycolicibacterium novocastrense]